MADGCECDAKAKKARKEASGMAGAARPAAQDRNDLGFAEQVLLWAIRVWVVGYHHQRPATTVLDSAFEFLGAPNAAALLNRAMMAVGAAGRRQIDIRPPCYRELSADERRLLEILGLAQQTNADAYRFLLLSLIKPHERQPSEALLRALARDLLQAGMVLDRPAAGGRPGLPVSRQVAGKVTVTRCQVVRGDGDGAATDRA
jgi:hypothetical protein